MKIGRKLVGTALCICMLLAMLGAMAVAAESKELVVNGAFTTLNAETSLPNKWSGAGDVTFVMQTGDASLGDYVKLAVEKGGDTPQISQSRANIDISGGQQYILRFRYKTATNLATQVLFTEYSGEDSVKSHTLRLEESGDSWQTGMYAFQAKAESTNLSLTFRLNVNYAPAEVCVDDVSLVEVSDAREYANGSFELLQEGGEPYGVTGGTVVTAENYSGNNSLEIAAGRIASVQLSSVDMAPRTSTTAGEQYIVTGYVKGAAGNTAVISLRNDNAGAAVLSSKTVSCTGNWQRFQFSGNLFSANAVVTVEAGNAPVYVDALALGKYSNLLTNGSFETDKGLKASKTSKEVDEGTAAKTLVAHFITQATDAPDGGSYLYFEPGDVQSWLQITAAAAPEQNTRYLFSFWYKTTVSDSFIQMYNAIDAGSGSARVNLYNTNGVWKQGEFTFEVLAGKSMDLVMRYDKELTNGQYVAIDSLELRELTEEEAKLAFYANGDFDAALGTYPVRNTYMNSLGQPVETAKDLASISAVYVTPTGSTAENNEVVVMAAYEMVNGVKQLVKVEFGIAELPTPGEDGAAVPDVYPTATMELTDVPNGAEIRAFVWDGVSGMKATGFTTSITK